MPLVAAAAELPSLPYSVRAAPAARHLLVTFAGVAAGRVDPPMYEPPWMAGLAMHRLFVGKNTNLLQIGTETDEAGAAVQLLLSVADRMRVPPRRITCVGHSYSGSAAIYIGLLAGVGRVLAGAPSIRLGTWGRRVARSPMSPPELRQAYGHLYAEGGVLADPVARTVVDRLIIDTAMKVRHRAHVTVFCSRGDNFYEDARMLTDGLASHPSVRCDLVRAEYSVHESVTEPFYRFAREQLSVEMSSSAGIVR